MGISKCLKNNEYFKNRNFFEILGRRRKKNIEPVGEIGRVPTFEGFGLWTHVDDLIN